jgi:CRISPR-associated protein Csy3
MKPVAPSKRPELPRVLSFERSLHPTTAVFWAADEAGELRVPVRVTQASLLGVRADPVDNATEGDYASGNPQRVEVASLPVDLERLEISFGLTVTPSSLTPRACDVPAFRRAVEAYTQAYKEAGGYDELARRYAANIANARFGWRNRLLASECQVAVDLLGGVGAPKRLTFDAFTYRLDELGAIPDKDREAFNTLAAHIRSGLEGPKISRLRVRAQLLVGTGAVVWPSQEFAERATDKTDVGKVLFKFEAGGVPDATGLHEQKVGAALRFIDTWHPGLIQDGEVAVARGQPLCVNPYGQHRDAHVVVRDRANEHAKDFYTLVKERIAKPPSTPEGDDHFLVACLVRGGVFPMAGPKQGSTKKASAEAT